MSFCTNCGKENEDNNKFCSNCGASLQKQESSLQEDMKPIYNYLKRGVIIVVLTVVFFVVLKHLTSNSQENLYAEEQYAFLDEEQSALTEEEQIKKYFYDWVERQIKIGNITRESISSEDDGGITEYGYADVDGDGKLDGLFGVCFYNGGNDIPCCSYLIKSETKGYAMIELNENNIKNLSQLKECFSDTRVSFSKLSSNCLEGSFIAYLEDDAHCCPSISGDFIVDYKSKNIISIDGESFSSKINKYSFYKVTGSYTGKVKEYMIENDKTLTYLSDIEETTITVEYENGDLFLYEDGKKQMQCVKLAKASNGYAFDVAFTDKNVSSLMHGYSDTKFNNAKYHGRIDMENNQLIFSLMINAENMSLLYTLFGLNLSERDLRDLGMRGVVLTYDLKKDI